jgi:hypothetical protein
VPRAIALVCFLAGCGRLGFGVTDDDPLAADASALDPADATDAAPTTIAHAQASAPVDVAGPMTMTLPASSTPGSLLVVTLGTSDTSNLVVPAGWTFATQIAVSGGCVAAILYYANNPGGIASVTFDQPSLVPTVAQLTEWTGATTLDATGTATSSSPVTMLAVQTATPATATGGIAIDVFCEAVNQPAFTAGPGWTNLTTASNGPAEASFITDYKLGIGPGVVGETVTTSVAGKYAAAIATFRAQ